MEEFLSRFWPWIAVGLDIVIATVTASHAVLHKRDSRSALCWVIVIWLAPFAGSLLYVCLGVNYIARRAHRLRPTNPSPDQRDREASRQFESDCESRCGSLQPLAGLVRRMTQLPLTGGNAVKCLADGETAYSAMLAAISSAQQSVSLCVYTFEIGRAARAFADVLIKAAQRGVAVRVLIDDLGSGFVWRSGLVLFKGSPVEVARFLPTLTPWHFRYSNLRNHRKILVVDGSVGFTGGMNITDLNYRDTAELTRARDVHFELRGPVVHQLQDSFRVDWKFTTGESIEGDLWYGPVEQNGAVLARVVSHGPDEDLDRLHSVIHGAISCAAKRILVVSPYFIPDYALISALNSASLRGVQVDIVVPSKVDVRLVQWASTTVFPQLIESGCRIWLSQPPFDHSKLMVVDGEWSLIGSANWDARSLRLNFELNVECYNTALASELTDIVTTRLEGATRVTFEWVHDRPLLARLRDGITRLASPFL